MTQTFFALLVARAVCSSAGVLYAVVARNIDGAFARAVLTAGSEVGGLHTVRLNARNHRNDPCQR